MKKRTGSRGANRDRLQAQSRTRGRLRTELIREGLDELELPMDVDHIPGPAPALTDLGADDEIDGDLVLEEAETSGPEAPFVSPFETGDELEVPSPRTLGLSDLIGSRPPIVLVRLIERDSRVDIEPMFTPTGEAAGQALLELSLFLSHRFHEGRRILSDQEWARLTGREPASIFERLLLLTRLAIGGNQEVITRPPTPPSPDAGGGLGGGADQYRFTPNDRGLERYANKFAALPDGMPFSLRLLLHDGRGRPDPHPFKQLPLAVKLEALRLALHKEAQERRAVDDDTLRGKLQEALAVLGISIAKPTWRHVINLRETLKRNNLGQLLQSAPQRQKQYDQLARTSGGTL